MTVSLPVPHEAALSSLDPWPALSWGALSWGEPLYLQISTCTVQGIGSPHVDVLSPSWGMDKVWLSGEPVGERGWGGEATLVWGSGVSGS